MDRRVRRALEQIEVPGEHEARERAWRIVQAAFAEREPARRRVRRAGPVLAFAAVLALVAAAVSPPGRAVLDEVRRVIGVERSDPALFSLPAPGRLLVNSDVGAWIVRPDGSKRLLGLYRHASWSPYGRFVVATGAGERGTRELFALDTKGEVRWSLARPGHIRWPRWGGSRIDTRIAYVVAGTLRLVAGDGTGDRLLARGVSVPPAWRPGRRHTLAYVAHRRLRVVETETGDKRWSVPVGKARALAWSRDGRRLLALTSRSLTIFDASGRRVARRSFPAGTIGVDAALAPRGHAVAMLVVADGRSELRVGTRRVFAGEGRFADVEWSPDGRWLLVAWQDADQWVFIRSARVRRIKAVSGITDQFESRRFPSIAGWCCP